MIPLDVVFDRIAKQEADKLAAVERTRTPQVVKELSEPTRHAVYHDGALTMVDHPLPTRGHAILTLDDFADAVKRWGDDPKSTVFVCDTGLTLICDDEYRRDRVCMRIGASQGFRIAVALTEGRTYSHPQLMQLLRTELRQNLLDSGKLFMDYVKSIRFQSKTSGSSAISQSGASMGQAVEMELHGVEGRDVPEEFELKVPVFAAPAPKIEETIRVDVTIDFTNMNFKLMTNEDLIQQAAVDSLKLLRSQLLAVLGDDFDPKRVLLGSV
jgi:hypothetical protein